MTDATTTPTNAAPEQNSSSQKTDQKNASTASQTTKQATPSTEKPENRQDTASENKKTKSA